MIYNLKFVDNEVSRVFFFSDFHHSHDPEWDVPLWKLRGFNSIEEHDRVLMENWNKKVSENDIVFYLGDLIVGAGKEGYNTFVNTLLKLEFNTLYVMPGNHYSGFKQLFDGNFAHDSIDQFLRIKILSELRESIYFIPNYYEISVNGQSIVLCHYPILSWNKMSQGAWHLHGHCHGNLHKTKWIENNYYKGKVLDIGPECNNEPISFNELKQIFKSRIELKVDHH